MVDNRFDLVLLASKRARQIGMGAKPMVEEESDKPTVIALREIAEGLVTREILDAIESRASAEAQEAERQAQLDSESFTAAFEP